MSSFFTIPGTQKKRKRERASELPKKRHATANPRSNGPAKKTAAPVSRRKVAERDESISGSDSDSGGSEEEDGDLYSRHVDESAASESGDDAGETAAERRLHLAERYLASVRQDVADEEAVGFDAEQIDKDLIAERLQEDVAESKGKVYRHLAGELAFLPATHTQFRWNTDTVTSVAVCAPFAYTTTKDMFLTKWRIQDLPRDQWPQTTRKKPQKAPAPPKKRPERVAWARGDSRRSRDKTYQGHTAAILAVAASQDGQLVVTGGADRRIVVWDAATLKPRKVFAQHHRDAVTALAFRRGTSQVYSASRDRTIKVWDADTGAYIQTLFGHQEGAEDVSALAQERCVSVSGDRTARLWRVVEETQLVFRGGGGGGGGGAGADKKKGSAKSHHRDEGVNGVHGHDIDPQYLAHEGSMDRVSFISDDLFVTGSDNGSIALWSVTRKKPLFVWPLAHGLDTPLRLDEASADAHPDPKVVLPRQPRWITALKAIPYSDVILSGSWDGCVRVWKLSEDKRRIEPVCVLGAGDDGGAHDEQPKVNGVNGVSHNGVAAIAQQDQTETGLVRGVVNEIAMFERGDRGKDGLCVVVATGKQHRLGRWLKLDGGRNGAVVFEVPRPSKREANGVNGISGDEEQDH